jgi:hypothetical protein
LVSTLLCAFENDPKTTLQSASEAAERFEVKVKSAVFVAKKAREMQHDAAGANVFGVRHLQLDDAEEFHNVASKKHWK